GVRILAPFPRRLTGRMSRFEREGCGSNPCGGATTENGSDFSRLFRISVKLRGRFDSKCSRFDLFHCRRREPLLIGRLGVAGDLTQTGVPGDRRDLMRGAACFGEPPSSGFAKPMRRAMAKVCPVALLAEPVAEAGVSEGLAELRHEERHLPGRAYGDDRLQIGVHRDVQFDASLHLANVKHAVADVLP